MLIRRDRFAQFTDETLRSFFRQRGLVLVREHWRSRPGMKFTGIKEVFVRYYVRRFPRRSRSVRLI